MNNQIAAKASKIISENRYLALATSDTKGCPWASTLFYAYDNNYDFYFISAKDSLHALHVNANKNVAITIYDSTAPVGEGDGVQIEAIAWQAGLTELPHIISVFYKHRYPDLAQEIKRRRSVDDFLGMSQRRFFVVRPKKIYTLDLTSTTIDKRIEVPLTDIINICHV